MPASVAVLSDVHGVLPVLDAVLAEPDVAAAELVVVTGDHAAGPMPVEVLDRLTGLGDRCPLVRGNADRELVSAALSGGCAEPVTAWAATQLRPEAWALLRGGGVEMRTPRSMSTPRWPPSPGTLRAFASGDRR